jgi:hypothetical protein
LNKLFFWRFDSNISMYIKTYVTSDAQEIIMQVTIKNENYFKVSNILWIFRIDLKDTNGTKKVRTARSNKMRVKVIFFPSSD